MGRVDAWRQTDQGRGQREQRDRMDPRADTPVAIPDTTLGKLRRCRQRTATTDGAFRDGAEIAGMARAAYCRMNTATTRPVCPRAVRINEPIGCAGVAACRGDIIAGDADGVRHTRFCAAASRRSGARGLNLPARAGTWRGRRDDGTYP